MEQNYNKKLPSIEQEMLWYLGREIPANVINNLSTTIKLKGKLDILALHTSLNEILRRHESLRTVFRYQDEKLFAVTLPPYSLDLKKEDLQKIKVVNDITIDEYCAKNAQMPFDLMEGPLIRAFLLRIRKGEFILQICFHRMIMDEFSIRVLYQELKVLYEDYFYDRSPSLNALHIQYQDYVNWQRNLTQIDDLKEYWATKLKDMYPLELPSEHLRSPFLTYKHTILTARLNKKLTKKLKKFASSIDVTLEVLIFAAFNVLLCRYSQQDDVTVGVSMPNRDEHKWSLLLGSFSNTVAVRNNLSGQPTFRELINRVKTVLLDAFAHKDFPFQRLAEVIEQDFFQSPLSRISFVMSEGNREIESLGEVEVSSFRLQTGAAKSDLTVYSNDLEEYISISLEYNAGIFNADRMKRLIRHLQIILEDIVEDPEKNVNKIELISNKEKHKILVEWNNTKEDYPVGKCLHQIFEEQVERTPENVAIKLGTQQLTYRQLNEKANRLGCYLRDMGVSPDMPVGICVERSLDMVIGLLGILKAGGAYVPLDPNNPIERLRFVIGDTHAKFILLEKDLGLDLMAEGTQNIYLDKDLFDSSEQDSSNVVTSVSPNNLMYIMYTSGSTGLPKGVMIEHKSVVNILNSIGKTVAINDEDVLVAVTTFSFDISVLEIFLPLISGATVVIAESEIVVNGERLGELLNNSNASIVQATPATWKLLLNSGWIAKTSLKIISGGEALPIELARRFLMMGVQLWNAYGPTEATIWSTIYLVQMSSQIFDTTIPIGRPCSNTKVFILDRHMKLLPIGIPGELYLGGDGLARGYFNRLDLDKDKFVICFTPELVGEKLYRTGDIALYLPDGNIAYLGRSDNQVKIRGYRIELGEVEAVLANHPFVLDAVVTTQNDEYGNTRLVANIVTKVKISISILRQYIMRTLPHYMVPSVFVFLSEMPLTPNGKIDRKALIDLNVKGAIKNLHGCYKAPQTITEKTIALIWEDVLSLNQISVDDNFFDMGGDSLSAMNLMLDLTKLYQMQIPTRIIYDYPTICTLASAIDSIICNEESPTLVPMISIPREEIIMASFLQEKWFYDSRVSLNMKYRFELQGPLNIEALELSIDKVVERHEALRTSFELSDMGLVQIINTNLNNNLKIVDMRNCEEKEIQTEQIFLDMTNTPFDRSAEPLIRATLIFTSPENYILILCVDRIASDIWSMKVLFHEIEQFYISFLQNTNPLLDDLDIQYADFSVWWSHLCSENVLDGFANYFRNIRMHSFPQLLPTDYPRSQGEHFLGAPLEVVFSSEMIEQLKSVYSDIGGTLFMIFLSIFAFSLHCYTGWTVVWITIPYANRNRPETKNLIGTFAFSIPIRIDFSDITSFSELITKVKAEILEAQVQNVMPYTCAPPWVKEKAREGIAVPKKIMGAPSVNFYLDEDISLSLPNMKIKDLNYETPDGYVDICLRLVEKKSGVTGKLIYRENLFRKQTAMNILDIFCRTANRLVTNPNVDVIHLKTDD